MTVTEVDCTLGALGMALGQFDDVRLVVEDVVWKHHTAHRLTATCHDLHLNPGPTLVAGPVTIELVLTSSDLPDPVEVTPDGTLRWAFVPLTPTVENGDLWITTGYLPLRRQIPVPPLPGGLHLTTVTTRPNEVVLTARSPQWRERLPLNSLTKLLRPA